MLVLLSSARFGESYMEVIVTPNKARALLFERPSTPLGGMREQSKLSDQAAYSPIQHSRAKL